MINMQIHAKITDNVTDAIWYDFDTPVKQVEEEYDGDLELSEEPVRSIEKKVDIIQPYKESIETINLGIEEDLKEVKLGETLEESVKERLIKLLHEYMDIFAWSYNARIWYRNFGAQTTSQRRLFPGQEESQENSSRHVHQNSRRSP